MDTGHAGDAHPTLLEVILRNATAGDDAALESLDPGSGSPWLDEVAEIVGGLIAWSDDPAERAFDRRVVVAEDDGQIVAMAAHERVEHERVGVLAAHRYLMVVAVRQGRQRSGLARTITEAVIAEMQSGGVQSVSWLIHPANAASLAFSRSRGGRVVTARGRSLTFAWSSASEVMSRVLRNVRFADVASLCRYLSASLLAVDTRHRSIEAKQGQARTCRHRGLTRDSGRRCLLGGKEARRGPGDPRGLGRAGSRDDVSRAWSALTERPGDSVVSPDHVHGNLAAGDLHRLLGPPPGFGWYRALAGLRAPRLTAGGAADVQSILAGRCSDPRAVAQIAPLMRSPMASPAAANRYQAKIERSWCSR